MRVILILATALSIGSLAQANNIIEDGALAGEYVNPMAANDNAAQGFFDTSTTYCPACTNNRASHLDLTTLGSVQQGGSLGVLKKVQDGAQ